MLGWQLNRALPEAEGHFSVRLAKLTGSEDSQGFPFVIHQKILPDAARDEHHAMKMITHRRPEAIDPVLRRAEGRHTCRNAGNRIARA